jgi:hypothetical protein
MHAQNLYDTFESLLQATKDSPDDAAAWSVLADYYEEFGTGNTDTRMGELARERARLLQTIPVLTEEDCRVEVWADYEDDLSPEDGACAHEGCEECHQQIREQLEAGNEWAWCRVMVIVRPWWSAASDQGSYQGEAHLGGCSYQSEEDFKKDNYYDDMKQEALDDLNEQIKDAWLDGTLTQDDME